MQPSSRSDKWGALVVRVMLAGFLGVGAGALLAWIAPSDKFSLAGLAVLPLWFLLEVFFEAVASGADTRVMRVASGVAVVAGFYFAWFALREVAF